MNNVFLVIIAVLLILSGTLLFFYNRDVLQEKGDESKNNCIPLNLQIRDITRTGAVVEWETAFECLGLVKYGDSVDAMDYIAIDEDNNFARKNHSIMVKNLKPASIYYLVVFSNGVEYGLEGSPVVINTKAF